MSTNNIHAHYFIENQKEIPKSSLFTFQLGAMTNSQWLKLPMSRTNFDDPKDF